MSPAVCTNQGLQVGHGLSEHNMLSTAEPSGQSAAPELVDRHVQCTRDIKATQTPGELSTVLQQRAADMNHISLSAAYNKASRLCPSQVLPEQQAQEVQQLLQVLHQLAGQLQQQCGPRELANTMRSCSRLRSADTVKQLLPEFLQDSKLQQANPQDVADTLRAVADLDLQLKQEEGQQLLQRSQRPSPGLFLTRCCLRLSWACSWQRVTCSSW
jgi:hypothetical protein